MTTKRRLHPSVVEKVSQLTADLTARPGATTELARLRRLAASVADRRGDVGIHLAHESPSLALHLPVAFEAAQLDALAQELEDDTSSPADARDADILELQRIDEASLVVVQPAHRLSGLLATERLGPFRVGALGNIWFDAFFAARARRVVRTGEARPLLVWGKALRPRTAGGVTTVKLQAGTVWVRGDLLSSTLPAGAYVGVRITGGTSTITTATVVGDDQITIGGPLTGQLVLELATDAVPPAADGCRASQAVVELPRTLTLTFTGSGVTVGSDAGGANAWGQRYEFTHPDGSWTFLDRLWTVVIGFEIQPTAFSLTTIPDDLVEFAGDARVDRAGLGLPVVVVGDPSVLGDASRGADWWLRLRDFTARWYEPDPRPHAVSTAWLGITPRGTTILAEAIAPLGPPVTHAYALWTTREQGGRVPWRVSYPELFPLLHRCDVFDGEQLLVSNRAEVALDRPVQTSGAPLPAAAGQGALMLTRKGSDIRVGLGLGTPPAEAPLQLALRNALVWTTTPALVFVQGLREAASTVSGGAARILLGVRGWSPTLPDPYVANVAPRAPNRDGGSRVTGTLLAAIEWTDPTTVTVSFAGPLGPMSAGLRDAKQIDHEASRSEGPRLGLTQVEQHALHLDDEARAAWKHAQARETETRVARLEEAGARELRGTVLLGNAWREVVDATPNVLLLDVSTNQDLLGVAIAGLGQDRQQFLAARPAEARTPGAFEVRGLDVHSALRDIVVFTVPAVQWEPVRTLDSDQDIVRLGWFPTPLASATDGGPTALGVRSQRLVPVVPDTALAGTYDAFAEGLPVGLRTTLPFGLVTTAVVDPRSTITRPADRYELTRPQFPDEDVVGGRQITAIAEGGRPVEGGISPTFRGAMLQTINGVDLASGAPLGLSVLGSTGDPSGSVETVFNNDMLANPRVPVTRFDVSGYGASNFSDWENPFAAFADTAKVQFSVIVGRTSLEIIKVNSVLHPWGIRVTRSITVERRPGGGVIRRDSGWQPISAGLFDYRYADPNTRDIVVADYRFDAGLFRGLFGVRSIRPAPGLALSFGGATFVPYYFDAEVALDGAPGRTPSIGILGFLQTAPNGDPASVSALRDLVQSQETIGGPIDAWIDVAQSGLRFRAQRVEVGLADDGAGPVFVATVRGMPKLPSTGAWSVVKRPVAGVAPADRESVAVGDSRGVPLVRRYPIAYPAGSTQSYSEPPLSGATGPYRFANAADLFTTSAPAHEYAILQSTPTHAFLFPRPYIAGPGTRRINTDVAPALADVVARTTSKAAFPPPPNVIELSSTLYLDISSAGTLALSAPVTIVGHPVPLRLAGEDGHGSKLLYDEATLKLAIDHDAWNAEFSGLRIYNDVAGMELLTGARLRVVGSTNQRPQIAEIESLVLPEIEDILAYIPLFGQRGVQGPIDLGATNAKHEFKIEAKLEVDVPRTEIKIVAGAGLKLKLKLAAITGFDKATGAVATTGKFGVALEGKIPVLSIGVASVFVIVSVGVDFSITSVTGVVTSEKLGFLAFAGVGVEGAIGPFSAYAYLGVGFALDYDLTTKLAKYGGMVALEAGIDFTIVKVKVRAELKGLVYKDASATKCNYSGSVKVQVDIFLIFSISASYEVSDTTTL